MGDGFKVDFYWPQLELIVETDGLRYHRTPAEQARDRYDPQHVERTLAAVARRLILRHPSDRLAS